MAIPCGISTVSGMKLKIKLNGSLNTAMISEERANKKILNVFFLGQINAIRGRRELNPKKITKRTKIRHENCSLMCALTKAIYSESSLVIINIKKKKSATTR
jgi:hypothetical protein